MVSTTVTTGSEGGLRAIRAERNLSLTAVAIGANRSLTYVSQVDRGLFPKNPQAQGMADIAKFLGVTVEELRGEVSS